MWYKSIYQCLLPCRINGGGSRGDERMESAQFTFILKKNKSPRKTLCAQNTAHISISLSLSAGTQKYGNNVKNAKLHSRSSSTIQTSKESRLVIAVSLFSSPFFLVAVMCVCVFVFLFFL
jgi:hypothetical protein